MVHGCMVYTEPVTKQRCKYTTSGWTFKNALKEKKKKEEKKKKLVAHLESHASEMSLLESGEQRYIKVISSNNSNNNNNNGNL